MYCRKAGVDIVKVIAILFAIR